MAGSVHRGKSSVLGQNRNDRSKVHSLITNPDQIADALAKQAMASVAGNIFEELTVPSGQVQYSQLTGDDIQLEGVGRRQESAEYPRVRISPTDLREATTEDIGGRFRVTEEAVLAGDMSLLEQGMDLLGAAIRDTLDDMLIEALATTTEPGNGGLAMVSERGWMGTVLTGSNPTPPQETPWADVL